MGAQESRVSFQSEGVRLAGPSGLPQNEDPRLAAAAAAEARLGARKPASAAKLRSSPPVGEAPMSLLEDGPPMNLLHPGPETKAQKENVKRQTLEERLKAVSLSESTSSTIPGEIPDGPTLGGSGSPPPADPAAARLAAAEAAQQRLKQVCLGFDDSVCSEVKPLCQMSSTQGKLGVKLAADKSARLVPEPRQEEKLVVSLFNLRVMRLALSAHFL